MFSENEVKSELVYNYYDALLGTSFVRTHRIDLQRLRLPILNLEDQERRFSMEEITAIVRETPSERAPGPNGFTCTFLKHA